VIELFRHEGRIRTFHTQLDGGTILADLCRCFVDPLLCPIDDHAINARMRALSGEVGDSQPARQNLKSDAANRH